MRAGRNSDDVYVFASTIGGLHKFSLHQSGDWRCAFTANFMADPDYADMTDRQTDRILDRWSRPEGNVVWGPSIRVRAKDLGQCDDTLLRRSHQISWLDAPPEGQATAIEMFFFQPEMPIELKGFRPIECMVLASGAALMVVAANRDISDEVSESIDLMIERYSDSIAPEVLARRGEPGLRAAIFGSGEDHRRYVWDTAF